MDNLEFSNNPSDHLLYNAENKLTVLKFKDEFLGDIITEFVALKPKLYSILSQSKYSKLPAQNCSKSAFYFQKLKNFEIFFLKSQKISLRKKFGKKKFKKNMSKKFRWKKNLVKKNLKKSFVKKISFEKKIR